MYSADDLATSVSTYIGDRIASLLEEKGFDVTRLDLWKANRLLFTLQRMIKPADFVVYCGHGSTGRWYGSLTMGGLIWPLVDLMNAGLLRDKVCYAIACRTGLQLGRGAPARSYLGWNVDVYVSLPAPERNYTGDFLDAFIQVPFALAEGKTVREVVDEYAVDIPARRLGRPEELAALVVFLASKRAAYITGTTIQVDGGYVRSLL